MKFTIDLAAAGEFLAALEWYHWVLTYLAFAYLVWYPLAARVMRVGYQSLAALGRADDTELLGLWSLAPITAPMMTILVAVVLAWNYAGPYGHRFVLGEWPDGYKKKDKKA